MSEDLKADLLGLFWTFTEDPDMLNDGEAAEAEKLPISRATDWFTIFSFSLLF